MKKIKRKKHRGKKQRRLALIVSCVTMVCAALLVSSVWSHDQRRKWQKAAQESSGTSSAPLETENAETPVPVREPAKPTPKPEDPTKQIYTICRDQNPGIWDWTGQASGERVLWMEALLVALVVDSAAWQIFIRLCQGESVLRWTCIGMSKNTRVMVEEWRSTGAI